MIGYDPDGGEAGAGGRRLPGRRGLPDLHDGRHRDNEQRRNEFDFLAEGAGRTRWASTSKPQFVDSKTRSATFNAEDFELFPVAGSSTTRTSRTRWSVCSTPTAARTTTTAPTRMSTRRSQEAANATIDDARITAYQDVETAIVDEPVRHHPDVPGRAAVPGEHEARRRRRERHDRCRPAGQLLRGVLVREGRLGRESERRDGGRPRRAAARLASYDCIHHPPHPLAHPRPLGGRHDHVLPDARRARRPFTQTRRIARRNSRRARTRTTTSTSRCGSSTGYYLQELLHGDLGISFEGDREVTRRHPRGRSSSRPSSASSLHRRGRRSA